MISLFIEHIRTKKILDEKSRYLLGLSGGVDSVCLGYFLIAAGIDFDVAHVNYGLRGEESDGDELFVRSLADKWGKRLFVKKVQENLYLSEGQSLQMAARNIRYHWFEDLCASENLAGVIVAHNFEDQVETVLLNLLRGTGIEGVFGMSEKRGKVIRPMLPFKRAEILDFMQTNQYRWREDSTNKKTDYKRNFLRNEVFPKISEKFPEGMDIMSASFKRIKDTGKAFFHLYSTWKDQFVMQEGDFQYLYIQDFKNLPGKHSLIYYWLRDYGYNFSDVEDVLEAVEKKHSGKVFYAGDFLLNIDRDMLILGKAAFKWESLQINQHDIQVKFKHGQYDVLYVGKDFPMDKNPQNAMLDLEKLSFPLELRQWEQGDKFMPLGMKNEKKISDLLIDLKVPLIEKKKVAVLVSNGEIAWVMGYRISEKFKCDENTSKILYLKKTNHA